MTAILWYTVALCAALFVSFLLASDQTMVALSVGAVGWLMLLPYHARLALTMSTVTFTSALVIPFFPGRPYVWEFAALLAWTGVPILVFLRRFPPDTARMLRENRTIFLGAVIYCATLFLIMYVRGFGFRVFGSGQMGGRYYVQQLLCSIFPLLFILCRLDEKTFVRLFLAQCALSLTFLISDFAFSAFGGRFYALLNFVELPNDALNFERRTIYSGLRRFQSLAFAAQGLITMLLVLFNLRRFFGRHGFWLIPTFLGLVGVGLLSGHRLFVISVAVPLVVCAYAQRFFRARQAIVASVLVGLALMLTYAFADRMPKALQRSVSFLPGIEIDQQAASDAASTAWVRRTLLRVGWNLIPDYFWVGRGFARFLDDYSHRWDTTTISFHINQGKFYNGFIGLMVNTGITGTIGMLLLLYGGTRLAWRVVQHLRAFGCEDNFSRVSILVASSWLTSAFLFMFLHGDSEWAMKTFSLLAGMLLLCDRFLRQRREAFAAAAAEAEASST